MVVILLVVTPSRVACGFKKLDFPEKNSHICPLKKICKSDFESINLSKKSPYLSVNKTVNMYLEYIDRIENTCTLKFLFKLGSPAIKVWDH